MAFSFTKTTYQNGVTVIYAENLNDIQDAILYLLEHGGGGSGTDGYSPTVSITDIQGGHRVTITDVNGPHTYDVMDGTDGTNGTNGTNGQNGQDGVSPAVTITEITGGHRVTITDKDHPSGQSFDVMDGEDDEGSPGSQLPRMDGTASAGSANAYSREDHVHPTDTSRLGAAYETFAKTVTFSAAGSTSLTDPRFTADHRLVGYQFFNSSNNVSGDILADITITTAAGSCSVTINTVYNAGSVVLTFAYAPASN